MINLALQSVDFLRPDGSPIPGLVSVRNSLPDDVLSIGERVAINDAKSFEHVDFVFFRRYSDGRSSQVAAYVVDNSSEQLDEMALAKLHSQVWIHGEVPLLYVAWPSRIDVLTCARGADFWDKKSDALEYKPIKQASISEAIKTAAVISEERRRFSAFRLADGTFWDDPSNKAFAEYDKTAQQCLIKAILEADTAIEGEKNPVLRRLLLLMVLIKYLEDRRVFPEPSWFGRYHKGAKSFFDVLRDGTPDDVYRLFNFLEGKFNGDVFRLPVEKGNSLTRENLQTFAELVEGKTLRSQRYLWQQYSFEHLPVEIISHIYQHFVQGGHGAVYTPPFLAGLLLDYAMPYESLTGEERVLDPACGSGVFLVGAFRRLVNVWRSRSNWGEPDVETLKQILKRSIHGVDLDSVAIDLTAFSLSLAICDALKPNVIWTKLKFDRLRDTNLFGSDFFSLVSESNEGKQTVLTGRFDVVVGNPPFQSKLTDAGKKVEKSVQNNREQRISLPDNQAAYLFLEQSLDLLRSNGRMCMIQPSSLLYNLNTQPFRTVIFRKHRIATVFDFTSIRNLYEADTKTIALLAHAESPAEDHRIHHWTFRRTASVHERICFELDHYDRHLVPQPIAESDQHVWRINLLGGGRLTSISRRLRQMRTLAEYVQEKEWNYGEGFIVGTAPTEGEDKRKRAEYLTDKPFLPTSAFTDKGIDEKKIGAVQEDRFESPRNEGRFSPPLILMKENESLPITFWDKSHLAFRHKIVGIHAPKSELSELCRLYQRLQQYRDLYRFCCMLNGSQFLVGKATAILKQDIDSLPFPENPKDLSLCFWEKVLQEDALEYMADYVRIGQNSQLLKKAADAKDLRKYSNLFVRMLGSVYSNLHAGDPVFLDGLTCQPFYFGEQPELSWLLEATGDLRSLIYDDKSQEYLRTIRVLRFYEKNVLLLIKPDRLRYWIRSTAIRDADETLLDLRSQGY